MTDPTPVYPLSEWHEEIGDVLWWHPGEAPYVGSPLDLGFEVLVTLSTVMQEFKQRHHLGGWPGYHKWWSPLPEFPKLPPPPVETERTEDAAVAAIVGFLDLNEGWDGENGAKPLAASASDAIMFLQAAGAQAAGLEPTLHVDGSVLLEADNGRGALQFCGDGSVSYALTGIKPGRAKLTRNAIPAELVGHLPPPFGLMVKITDAGRAALAERRLMER